MALKGWGTEPIFWLKGRWNFLKSTPQKLIFFTVINIVKDFFLSWMDCKLTLWTTNLNSTYNAFSIYFELQWGIYQVMWSTRVSWTHQWPMKVTFFSKLNANYSWNKCRRISFFLFITMIFSQSLSILSGNRLISVERNFVLLLFFFFFSHNLTRMKFCCAVWWIAKLLPQLQQ